MGKKLTPATYMFSFAVIVLLGVVGLAATKSAVPSVLDDFAKCLTSNEAVMYGAYWCSHCENQKQMFGTAWKYVTYVECSVPGDPDSASKECTDAGIEGFPTWKTKDGTLLSGEQTLEKLSEVTGCALPNQY